MLAPRLSIRPSVSFPFSESVIKTVRSSDLERVRAIKPSFSSFLQSAEALDCVIFSRLLSEPTDIAPSDFNINRSIACMLVSFSGLHKLSITLKSEYLKS
jgi:hypothetical protein